MIRDITWRYQLPIKRKSLKFHIESLGCAKNQVDSEVMIASLEGAGLIMSKVPEEADIIIVNTCGFIGEAKEESIETTLAIKEKYPHKQVVMAGCLVRRYEDNLRHELNEIDAFWSGENPAAVSEILPDLKGLPVKSHKRGKIEVHNSFFERKHLLSFPGSAYVKIAEGCSNNCSYCAIPLIRGTLKSREIHSVVSEIKALIGRGIFEINIIAQDLASFGVDRGSQELEFLLNELSAMKGEFWIRLLYIHPDHFSQKLLPIIRDDTRILPYFDLPFQHASPAVLGPMGREGSKESYLSLIEGIRRVLPDAVIRSTFLVGFPGESRKDFLTLIDFIETAQLDWAGVFAYSREEDTRAFSFTGKVAGGVARRRKREIEELQLSITGKRLKRFIGRELTVLVEERVQGEDLFLARAYLQAPEVDGLTVVHGSDLQAGETAAVRIVRCNEVDLEAVVSNA